ncbi:hypothetical protein ASPZODRAFT_130250 [Penicilliopsis zonata CBS 506.65]|uniref:Bacteriophage T5 Orf172 DNA-binding domain-containing protein n=1 Tax=Penicilliopsis zonata CBS 506.65 TaxID=1073090 RepID=A0A1L9SM58_9EURO|nr:hypothetical protein ASPZODRAFT_130250 [Penicilliopsis zonata CBS 506.65]OJJ48278.1 hypothetical protein ASPZODRAFT_130250 [Penicilliopsis zonata CBS 506.65]
MPHIANTPESRLPRSDSRNPATTCRGITSTGRPCRRALASPVPGSTSSGPVEFCWQHQDQAITRANQNQNQNQKTGTAQAQERSSIDTLVDRLGLLELNVNEPKRQRTRTKRPRRRWCCFEIGEEEDNVGPPVRKTRPGQTTTSTSTSGYSGPPPSASPISSSSTPSRPSLSNQSSSQTKPLLSWIPPSLSPQTSSLLAKELAKPISSADEVGYIYMFWVTQQTPPGDIASSLVPPPDAHHNGRPGTTRSVSEAIRAAQDLQMTSTTSQTHTIRLKIGRTSNVQRRLNEWTRQCSHHLTLIRYYPYSPSSGSSPSSTSLLSPNLSAKVNHVHRVERLIHIELRDIKARDLGMCPDCGKEHREWFDIPATKEGLRRVDECVRRWVDWAAQINPQ